MLRSRWKLTPVRLAGVVLLLIWLGPVTLDQTDSWTLMRLAGARSASAESQMIPAGKALALSPGTRLRLRMRDGSTVRGCLLGRTLLDPAEYAGRFASQSEVSAYRPFALGETLEVALLDGRVWNARFAGYGELTLLVVGPEGETLRVPFEFAKEIRGANGDPVDPKALALAFRAGQLPSAEALALEQDGGFSHMTDRWATAKRVAAEDVEFATLELPVAPGPGATSGGEIAGGIVLGVLVGVILFYVLIGAAIHDAGSSCSGPRELPPLLSDLTLTVRRFDRNRGCYEGEALAAADPWSGKLEAPALSALAAPAAGAGAP